MKIVIIFNLLYKILRLAYGNSTPFIPKYSDIEDTLNIIISFLIEEKMRVSFGFLNIFSTLAVFLLIEIS